MLYKRASSQTGYIQITFHLPSTLWASKVTVMGDFNHWNPSANFLVQNRTGCWEHTVELPVNKQYRFIYCVDGELLVDYHADDFIVDTDSIPYGIIRTELDDNHPAIQE